MSKMKRRSMKMCYPAMCDHCTYIGEGDFICDRFEDEDGNPAIVVMSDWEPTEDYLKCKGGGDK